MFRSITAQISVKALLWSVLAGFFAGTDVHAQSTATQSYRNADGLQVDVSTSTRPYGYDGVQTELSSMRVTYGDNYIAFDCSKAAGDTTYISRTGTMCCRKGDGAAPEENSDSDAIWECCLSGARNTHRPNDPALLCELERGIQHYDRVREVRYDRRIE